MADVLDDLQLTPIYSTTSDTKIFIGLFTKKEIFTGLIGIWEQIVWVGVNFLLRTLLIFVFFYKFIDRRYFLVRLSN